MIAEFKNVDFTLPEIKWDDSSRVWIFMSNRFLSDSEVEAIITQGDIFIENWAAHGSKLHADVLVLFHHFVIMIVDQTLTNASGCSIDKMTHWMQGVGNLLNIDFFDRTQVALVNSKNPNLIQLVDFRQLQDAFDKNQIDENDLIFNNLIDNLGDLKHSWLIPLHQSKYYSFIKT